MKGGLKPVISIYNVAFCPVCDGSLWQIRCECNYCFRCGTPIDWGLSCDSQKKKINQDARPGNKRI